MFNRIASHRSDVFVLVLYVLSLFSTAVVPSLAESLFLEPGLISFSNWVRAFFALLLVTFLPGWALLKTLNVQKSLSFALFIPLSCVVSIFSSFFVGYSLLSLGYAISDYGHVAVLFFNLFVLCIWFISWIFRRDASSSSPKFTFNLPYFKTVIVIAIVITFVSTFLLYGFDIVGDQRFQHGVALLYSESFPVIEHTIVPQYPYFFSIFLAVFFSLSGLPTILAYNLLNVLMILPIMFYYVMVSSLFGKKHPYVPPIATLFAFTSAGFGWIHFLFNQSQYSLVNEAIYHSWRTTYDILTPNSFFLASNPDVTSPLQLFALPAIFLIVTFLTISPKLVSSNFKSTVIAFLVVFAFLIHPESVLVILLVLIVATLFFKNSFLSLAVTCGLALVFLFDLISPGRLYIVYPTFSIFGINFSLLQIVLILGISSVFMIRLRTWFIVPKLKKCVMDIEQFVVKSSHLLLSVVVVLFVYFYCLSLIVLNSVLPTFTIGPFFGSGIVPWYLLPLRFGVVGLLGVVGLFIVLKRCFKESIMDKNVLILFVWMLLTILASFGYSEFRMHKHLQLVLSIFLGFTISKIIEKLSVVTGSGSVVNLKKTSFFPKLFFSLKKVSKRIVIVLLICLLFLGSIGSSVLYFTYKWNEVHEIEASYHSGTSTFLQMTDAEIEALEWLKNTVDPLLETVITVPRGPANQFSEVNQLAGMWIARNLPQHFPFFETSRSDTFMILAKEANLKYIYLNQQDEDVLKNTYAEAFIGRLLPYLPVAFKNDEVTIYSYPSSFIAPVSDSNFAIIASSNEAPLHGIQQLTSNDMLYLIPSLLNSSYTVISHEDSDISNYQALLIGDVTDVTANHIEWTKSGGQLVVLSVASDLFQNVLVNEPFDVSMGLQNWQEFEPSWQVINGSLVQKINDNFSTIVLNYTVSDFDLTTDLCALETSAKDNHAGVIFRFVDLDNHYYLFLRPGSLSLYKRVNGTGQEVWKGIVTRSENSQQLRIVANGSSFTFYIDDALIGTYVDSEPIIDGKIGFRTSMLNATFDNLLLRELPELMQTNGLVGSMGRVDFSPLTVTKPKISVGDNLDILANFVYNETVVSPFAILEQLGTGSIVYLNIDPFFSQLSGGINYTISGSQLLTKMAEMFNAIDLLVGTTHNNIQTSEANETFRTDYAKFPINLEGNVEIATSSFYVDGLNHVRMSIVENNQLFEYVLDDVETDSFSLKTMSNGDACWLINCSALAISSLSSGPYVVFTVPSRFSVFLDGNAFGELEISQGNVIINKIQINESTTVTFDLIQNISVTEKNQTFFVRNPFFCVNGTSFFDFAQFRDKADLVSIISDGSPLFVYGSVSFRISWSDKILLVDELRISGETETVMASTQSNSIEINWGNVFKSQSHCLLLVLILVSLFIYLKKPFAFFSKTTIL